MTDRVILSPCWTGTRSWGWYPWLADALARKTIPFGFADMPNPDLPDVDAWADALLGRIDQTAIKDTILVGHSLGCLNILNTLKRLPNNRPTFRAIILIAPFSAPLGIDIVDRFQAQSTAANLASIGAAPAWIIASDDDPYIPDTWGNLDRLTHKAAANMMILHNRAHFSEASGCTELPELLSLIQTITEACDDPT